MTKLFILFTLLIMGGTSIQAQTFPSNFTREQVGGIINSPTVMAFANDGRIFVAEQSGALKVIKNNALLATPFISIPVNSTGERGLIGIALDPDFPTTNFIYLYYTVNSAPIHNRISRFTATGDMAIPATEQIILELDNLSTATNHNGGALAFGKDGKLYVAVGDNAFGANAQNLDTYHGKMLRINKDGGAPTDNPFFSPTATEQKKRVWSYGLRNPYTFSIHPVSGKIFVNDVGQGTWEEINDASVGGRNFGWPSTEGVTSNSSFSSPIYAYHHRTGTPIGCAITGGVFFNPSSTNYPAQYIGKFFFQDYCENWIYWIDPSASPVPTSFASSVGIFSLSIAVGLEGNLYYLSRGTAGEGRLYRIKYTAPTIAPSIAQQPSAVSVSVAQSATFSVVASGSTPLTYQWQKNNANIPSATQSIFTISQVQLTDAGNYKVIITNSAGSVTSSSASLTVISPNQKPTASILLPVKNTLYTAGSPIGFSGQGTDPEDGDLPASAFSWQVNFHHDTHQHDEPIIVGVKQSTYDIPNQGETADNVWYRFILTVKDSQSQVARDSVDVYPKKSLLTFETIPPDLQLTLDGQPFISPTNVRSVQGMLRTIGVISPQEIGNQDYEFTSWSSGGAANQTIATPSNDATYTATFSLVLGTDDSVLNSKPFPNPANEWIYIKGNESKISLQDVVGKEWETTSGFINGETNIYVGNVPSGFYFLKLDSTKERLKILIQH